MIRMLEIKLQGVKRRWKYTRNGTMRLKSYKCANSHRIRNEMKRGDTRFPFVRFVKSVPRIFASHFAHIRFSYRNTSGFPRAEFQRKNMTILTNAFILIRKLSSLFAKNSIFVANCWRAVRKNGATRKKLNREQVERKRVRKRKTRQIT